MNQTVVLSSLLALLNFSMRADGLDVGPPVLGYALDTQAGAVLRMTGVPGASVATPLELESSGFTNLVVASERGYGLSVAGNDADVLLLRFHDDGHTEAIKLAVDPAPDQIVLSPAAGWASLRYGSSNRYCILKDLPDAPVVDSCFHADQGGDLLAVSDQGSVIIATGNGAQLARKEGLEALPASAPVSAAAFRPNREDVALFSAGEMRWIAGNILERVVPLAGNAPLSAQFSRDGSRVYVADAQEESVGVVDMTHFTPGNIPYRGKISRLQRLNGNAVFLLAHPDTAGIRVLDGGTAAPRIVFVPRTPSQMN